MMIMTIQEIGEVVKEEIKAEAMVMMIIMIVILKAPFREGDLVV